MMKSKMKKTIIMLLCLVGVCGASQVVYAEDYSYMTNTAPAIYEVPSLQDGKTAITWFSSAYQPEDSSVVVSYDVELSDDTKFEGAKTFTTNAESLTLNQSEFGKNGGKFYVRVRTTVNVTGDTPSLTTSDWSEAKEMVYVKINKTNFPGMYKVLKNGGQHNTEKGREKIIYDTNKDGWLDPAEIENVNVLGTMDNTKKKNGTYKTVKATNISSFKGIEYLTGLDIVSIDRFSGKKADLSKCPAYMVDINGISAKQITVNAPNATMLNIQADEKTKVSKIDLSKCSKAVDITVYGNDGTKTLKLPKEKKNLKILSLSEYGFKSLNMNSYTNLQQLYIYECDVKSVKVNKCKNLRYIYFYYCDKIKSLNLKSNKKLRGADFYKTPGLTKTTVKTPKNGKYTWNKGKWWYSSSAYKKDMKKLYD